MFQRRNLRRAGTLIQDPTELALSASERRRVEGPTWYPPPLDADVGRRLLLAQLEYSRWTLRRVEKVRFERERSVSREITIDLNVRDDAPVVKTLDGRECYLVPLSVMRRRTLVNLALTDETQSRLPMLGLRLTQQLDESMLMAAVGAQHPDLVRDEGVEEYVQRTVAGEYEQVEAAHREEGCSELVRAELLTDEVFLAARERLRHNFTLYVLLDKGRGRHRILTLAFDEPNGWSLQQAGFKETKEGLQYLPGEPVPRARRLRYEAAARLGLGPIRIRFQIPGAEHATSYHFEATSPQGVRIVRASLVAGRPNEPGRRCSWDELVGHTPTIGLHAVEVPYGSLCRVQLELRVPSRGWFMTLVASCALIATVMFIVAVHWTGAPPRWTETQVTNVAVILITVSASAATLVAQREFGGLAATMLTGLRTLGVLAFLLPILMAGSLVFAGGEPWPDWVEPMMYSLTGLSLLLLFLVLTAWRRSRSAENRKKEQASPWDMTAPESRHTRRYIDTSSTAFEHLASTLGFNVPAVGIPSAEGWHDHYSWSDSRLERVKSRLREPQPTTSRRQSLRASAGLLAAVPAVVWRTRGVERR